MSLSSKDFRAGATSMNTMEHSIPVTNAGMKFHACNESRYGIPYLGAIFYNNCCTRFIRIIKSRGRAANKTPYLKNTGPAKEYGTNSLKSQLSMHSWKKLIKVFITYRGISHALKNQTS